MVFRNVVSFVVILVMIGMRSESNLIIGGRIDRVSEISGGISGRSVMSIFVNGGVKL